MPARSVSCASSGENGALSWSLMVSGSTTSTCVDDADLGLAERALHGEVAVEAVLGGLRVERLAVMELHAGPQLDRDRLAVGRGLVAEGELRHDVQLLVDVEQLVAERGEDDAADIGARQRRVEHVGILGEADAQVGLRERHVPRQRGERERQRKTPVSSCCPPRSSTTNAACRRSQVLRRSLVRSTRRRRAALRPAATRATDGRP